MEVAARQNLIYLAIFPPNYKSYLNYLGYVRSVSSVNERGPFDILPMHENFVTVATGNITAVDENGRPLEFNVQKGVVDVSNNIVKVFVDY